MKRTYKAVVKKDAGSWIGWIEEVRGVNCQARTRDVLRRRLKATLEEALEMTLYLVSIPGMRESIRRGLKTRLSKTSENPGW